MPTDHEAWLDEIFNLRNKLAYEQQAHAVNRDIAARELAREKVARVNAERERDEAQAQAAALWKVVEQIQGLANSRFDHSIEISAIAADILLQPSAGSDFLAQMAVMRKAIEKAHEIYAVYQYLAFNCGNPTVKDYDWNGFRDALDAVRNPHNTTEGQ